MLTNGIHRNQLNEDDENDQQSSLFNDEEIDTIVLGDDIGLKYLKKLKILRLENCTNITDLGLVHGLNLSQLTELDIKLCTNITGAIVSKSENLNLKIFNMNQCVNFKTENLIEILKYSKNTIRQLYCSACPAITNNIIELLRTQNVILNVLDVSYCNNVNDYYMDLYEQYLFNEYCSKDFFIDRRFISKS
jgi:hypothetical protein